MKQKRDKRRDILDARLGKYETREEREKGEGALRRW